MLLFQMVRSSVNFQVPLIIIVPHREAPPLPLLPLPMTVTSYHGNQINLQDHGLSLHIAPVWAAWSTGHGATAHKMFPAHTMRNGGFSGRLLFSISLSLSILAPFFFFFFGHFKPKKKKLYLQDITRDTERHCTHTRWQLWLTVVV